MPLEVSEMPLEVLEMPPEVSEIPLGALETTLDAFKMPHEHGEYPWKCPSRHQKRRLRFPTYHLVSVTPFEVPEMCQND